MSLRNILGLSGVAKNENKLAQYLGNKFEFWMVLIAIWLPVQWAMERHQQLSKFAINMSNWLVWSFFLIETVCLFLLVDNKKKYIFTNWMNLVVITAGFPLVWTHTPLIGIIRGLQLLIMTRLLLPWWDSCIQVLGRNRLGATLVVAIIITSLWGVLIYFVDPTIKSPWDGIWWAWETLTTVGYGDIVPTNTWGRLLGIVLMLMGILLVSLLTANFSAFLIGKTSKKIEKEEEKILSLIQTINNRLNNIEKQLTHLNTIEKFRSSE